MYIALHPAKTLYKDLQHMAAKLHGFTTRDNIVQGFTAYDNKNTWLYNP